MPGIRCPPHFGTKTLCKLLRINVPISGKLGFSAESIAIFDPYDAFETGAFATAEIRQGGDVIEYLGRRIDKAESQRQCHQCQLNNPFVFYLDEEFDLDGNAEENPARWLNHSYAPNCEAQRINGRIWIVALRQIRAGEELTFNYGYVLENFREYPCQCGAPGCVGYILAEEFHSKLG